MWCDGRVFLRPTCLPRTRRPPSSSRGPCRGSGSPRRGCLQTFRGSLVWRPPLSSGRCVVVLIMAAEFPSAAAATPPRGQSPPPPRSGALAPKILSSLSRRGVLVPMPSRRCSSPWGNGGKKGDAARRRPTQSVATKIWVVLAAATAEAGLLLLLLLFLWKGNLWLVSLSVGRFGLGAPAWPLVVLQKAPSMFQGTKT